MMSNSIFKNTVLFLFSLFVYTVNAQTELEIQTLAMNRTLAPLQVGAEQFETYASLLQGKKVGIVTNQTGVVYKTSSNTYQSTVDYLLEKKVRLTTIYAPEHGFRGTADAGEQIKDGQDTKTGLPIISLYGNNKKPSAKQLQGIDIMLFDLQDVGARFYTYISTLHYLMEACAEQKIPLIVFDRPNPNITIVDGPTLEMKNKSFVGMHPIPTMHGMTIGEYAQMINGEKWLLNEVQTDLTVIPVANYDRTQSYSLPVAPSPNLPNDQAINLYASLCFFEGTNVSSGRGTDLQFQIYGSPFLKNMLYQFTPKPNFGSKDPMNNGKLCYGENLSDIDKVDQLELKWLLKAYRNTREKEKFFTNFFIKLAGTDVLQKQIELGLSEDEIRQSWQADLQSFLKARKAYLLY